LPIGFLITGQQFALAELIVRFRENHDEEWMEEKIQEQNEIIVQSNWN
jgi:hypothetical protein